MALRPDDRLTLMCHDNVVARLLTTPPPTADISITIAISDPQVGPGPVPFRATVHNAGPATPRPILNLAATKQVRITASTGTLPLSVKADRRRATATLPDLAPRAGDRRRDRPGDRARGASSSSAPSGHPAPSKTAPN